MKYLLIPAILALLAGVPKAEAASVLIWPIDPVINPGEQSTNLWIENRGTSAVTLQVRSFAWSQSSGTDTLTPQQDVVASPPIASVPAGGRQLVRVIRRAPQTGGSEQAYRLLIDELPQAALSGSGARLSVQMRYSIPLFTYSEPGKPAAAMLFADIRQTRDGRDLVIRNAGSRHARLTDLRLETKAMQTMVKPGLAGYVLAGQSLHIPLPDGAAGVARAGVDGTDRTLSPGI